MYCRAISCETRRENESGVRVRAACCRLIAILFSIVSVPHALMETKAVNLEVREGHGANLDGQ